MRIYLYFSLTRTTPRATMVFQLLVLLSVAVASVFGLEPSFDVPVINVTIQEGDTAVLPCSVDFLGEHKVVWTDQWSTLLTLDDRRIIDDPRISIERPFTRDWNLHVRKVQYNDRGQYTCQINTNPVKTKSVMLIVLVPSKIINERSSKDKTVREADQVVLVCNVTGVPIPEVTWYKLPDENSQTKESLDLEPGSYTFIDSCAYTLKQTGIGTAGEVLIIHNVSRYCDGTYECVAYNDVDPAVTRQIKVHVEFAPEVALPTKKMGQYIGRETILDCEITAHPHGEMYWMKDGENIDLFNKDKYTVELYSGNEDSKRKTLSLRVKNIQEADFGDYTCFARNTISQDKESMILYDYETVSQSRKDPTPPTKPLLPTPKNKFDGYHTDPFGKIVTIKPNAPDTDIYINGNPRGSGGITRGQGRQGNRPYTGKEIAEFGYQNDAVKAKGRTYIKCSGTYVTVCQEDAAAFNSNDAIVIHHSMTSIVLVFSLITPFVITRFSWS